MLEAIKKRVYEANIQLVKQEMVIFTWGNVSEIDRESNLVVIKPSGIEYSHLAPDDMVVVELSTGNVVEGKFKPSSDSPTHLQLYKDFGEIGGITHTHSINAVAFAQAGMDIPALGTTHADYFYGDIPCTRELSQEEVENGYEINTGKVITETVLTRNNNIMSIPGIIVKGHGPFAWGKDAIQSVYNAVVMEKVAEIDIKTILLNPASSIARYVLEKHYMRKHGPNAYYGQN